MRVVSLLALLATLVALTAAKDVTVGEWTSFEVKRGGNSPAYVFDLEGEADLYVTDLYCPGDRYTVEDGQVTLGTTSAVATPSTCTVSTGNGKEAYDNPVFSKASYKLDAGHHVLKFTLANAPRENAQGSLIVVPRVAGEPTTPPTDPSTPVTPATSRFVVVDPTAKGRIGASLSCATKGYKLAEITSTTFQEALKAVRESALTPVSATGGSTPVFVSSWDGNSYGDADLVLHVSATYGSINVADGNNHYVLCDTTGAAAPAPLVPAPVPSIPPAGSCESWGADGKFEICGPAGLPAHAAAVCAQVGKEPAILTGRDPAGFAQATTLLFNSQGVNSRAWIGGWEVPFEDAAHVLAAGSQAPGGAVVIPNDVEETNPTYPFLCYGEGRAVPQRRSEL
ncbi:hypothetical protein H9P43_003377 [Blastocladiella emersonii ATCC 22665]|nr:hypothetical protein H9P43_003377 [Blastocladiella emersonii ATCC 22665]